MVHQLIVPVPSLVPPCLTVSRIFRQGNVVEAEASLGTAAPMVHLVITCAQLGASLPHYVEDLGVGRGRV